MPRLETKIPEYNFLGGFWKNLRQDITGNGVVDAFYTRRRQRRILKTNARRFLNTPYFIRWAELSGADPDALREDLLHAYLNS